MSRLVERPEACRLQSRRAEESLAGTAPHPRAWLALEQPGPWGRKAPSSSHLDRELGAAVDARAKAAGVTFVLIRRPGRHADRHQEMTRTIVSSHPERGWLEVGTIDDPRALLDLDLPALAEGSSPGLGGLTAEPLVLICTNGRRDLCCAEVGRALTSELATSLQDALWESSHLGGHRFAPTVLLLPAGIVLGRATADDVRSALAGDIPMSALRGRTALSPAAQAAEVHIWAQLAPEPPVPLFVAEKGAGPWTLQVRHPDGRAWQVDVVEVAGAERPESCGRELEPLQTLVVTRSTLTTG